jgi:hypothetical protein
LGFGLIGMESLSDVSISCCEGSHSRSNSWIFFTISIKVGNGEEGIFQKWPVVNFKQTIA